jgi:hypothetical protein
MSAARRLAPAVFLLVGVPTGVLLAPGCGVVPKQKNLLTDLDPAGVTDVTNAARMTDGVASEEGDFWDTDMVARIRSVSSSVVYDLGSDHPIRCVFLQGDDNDNYQLSGSADGRTWSQLWVAEPVHSLGAGMRTRYGQIQGQARYVRVTASGGDGLYTVGEVGAYDECPRDWPPVLDRATGRTPEDAAGSRFWWFIAASVAFLFFHRKNGGWIRALLVLLPLYFGFQLTRDLIKLYPFWKLESAVRATVAALAGVVVLREAFSRRGREPDPRVMKGVLAVLAVASLGCYYHFGALQFRDQAKGRFSFVHPWDMRHYFPLAKYFRELRFDGLYAAQAAAYIDLHPGMTVDSIRMKKFRDLRDSEMRTAGEMAEHIREVKTRFSPERWELFKSDMRYFVDNMGPNDYLGGMGDHGGNATPVWILAGYALFAHAPANELTLTLGGLIDVVLVLTLFFFVWRCFGLRVMLYVVILFGATDFYQFGSNLVGSTLRQDWLVAAGLGACALRRKRWLLGGALLAYSGLIRAFPAMAAMFLPVPVLWAVIDFLRTQRRLLRDADVREIVARERPALLATAGAAAAVIVLVGLSSAMFGWSGAWGNWMKKIEIHATGPSVNNVGLRNVLMFEPSHIARRVIRDDRPEPWEDWQRYQVSAFARRKSIFYLVNLVFAGLALLACRKRPLEQVALLGLTTVPFIFYPSNYYCHFIFLLPMAAAFRDADDPRDKGFALGVAALLAICVAQYFALIETWSDLRYTYQSFALLGGCLAFVLPLAWQSWRELRPPRLAPAPAPAPEPPPDPEPPKAPAEAPTEAPAT